MALTNVPRASLRRVGAPRYAVMRAALFPSCRVPHGELLRCAEALSEALSQLAQMRKIPAFSGEPGWYGIDRSTPVAATQAFSGSA